MNDPFGGLEESSKFNAITEAFKGFFENVSKRPKQYNDSARKKFGLISYKTRICGKPAFEEVYPMRLFPPVPDIDELLELKPGGDSPLFEAIERGIETLNSEKSDNKTLIIVTGDSLSNCKLKSSQIDGIVARIKNANICASILQSGHAERDCFKFLVEKLKPVLVKDPSLEPKIAQSVRQMREWLEALC